MTKSPRERRLPVEMFDPLAATTPPDPASPPPKAPKARAAHATVVPPAALPEDRPSRPPARTSRGRRLTSVTELGPRGYAAGGRPPAMDLGSTPPVRLTVYLAPDHVRRLREEVRRRQDQGERTDMSALLRRAVDAFLPPGA